MFKINERALFYLPGPKRALYVVFLTVQKTGATHQNREIQRIWNCVADEGVI